MSTNTAEVVITCAALVVIGAILIVAMLTGYPGHMADLSGCAAGCFR